MDGQLGVVEQHEPVLVIECSEPDGKVVRTVSPTKLDVDRLKELWEKLKDFDVLFNDFVEGDIQAFMGHFIRVEGDQVKPQALIWDVDDVGILYINQIRPLDSCQAHFVFWDRRYRGREELIKSMCKFLFKEYKFRRINVQWPLYAKFSIHFMERMGFVNEGRLREATLYKGDWFDLMLFSLMEKDLVRTPSDSVDWKRHPRVCLSCGDTFIKNEGEVK
jgi:RimJ/RimL family protein N-acetyltransferase